MSARDDTPHVAPHPSVAERLARLAPDQRAAATAPPGPVLCVAPAGSGKTTTLVSRIAWLVDSGTPPDSICAVTFNKRAADELEARLTDALRPLGVVAGRVRVRTFHALGREILRGAGRAVEPLIDRGPLLRRLFPKADRARLRQLDDLFSRLKLDRGLRLEDVVPVLAEMDGAPEFVAYEQAVRDSGGLDFDDLVALSLRILQESPADLARWRAACRELLVDEVQDVDRTQLRLALHLAAPDHRIFLVGDDDQSIYGWRLADVRRVLALAQVLPGLRRIDLVTNYRCPGPVVHRAVRLIERNRERFAKEVRAGPKASGMLILAPDSGGGEDALRRFLAAPLPENETRAVLARTNHELMLPLAIALDLGLPVRATAKLLLEEPAMEGLLHKLDEAPHRMGPALLRVAELRDGAGDAARGAADEDGADARALATAMLGWAVAHPRDSASEFAARIREAQVRLAALRSDDAPLILATAHGTKGLEFDEVAVIGLDEGRFPSERSLAEAEDPERVLEEERRLAYVAWTRAKRTLTLVYDPLRPSPFLLEAFTAEELNLPRTGRRTREPAGQRSREPRSGSPVGARGPPEHVDVALEFGTHGPLL